MNIKRFGLAALAVFVFVFLYEMFVNGFLLADFYGSTPQIWRKGVDIEANMRLHLLLQLVLSVWITFVFTQIYPEGGLSKGLLFGLFFGIFAAILTSSWYIWLPVVEKLGVSWFVSSLVEGLGCGFLLGAIYRR